MRPVLQLIFIVAASLVVALVGAEIYLSSRAPQGMALPFYNKIYPYVMFRPWESYTYETNETHAMSHNKSRIFVYTNEDGFRIPKAGYPLPKKKPAGQFRIAFLGPSVVQLGSTFDTALPGSLKLVLQKRYPGRDIEVINAGIQSSVSRQSLVQLLLHVVDYQPDMVIIYDGVNDLGLPLTYESRDNFPYNFQTMEEAWNFYREQRREPVWRIALERSEVFRILRGWWNPTERKVIPTADDPFAGTNAVTAEKVIEDKLYTQGHVAAYLSNWRKLIELGAAYHYKTVGILAPTPGLNREWAKPRMMKEFRLDEHKAAQWTQAFQTLYDEAARQIETLRKEYPDVTFMNMTYALQPPDQHFWDMIHVYDESNMILAEKIYKDIQPAVDSSLRSIQVK